MNVICIYALIAYDISLNSLSHSVLGHILPVGSVEFLVNRLLYGAYFKHFTRNGCSHSLYKNFLQILSTQEEFNETLS